MIIVKLIEFLRTRLKLVIRISWIMLVLLVILDALPFIVDKHHAHTKMEHFPVFWAAFGFFSCVLIIFISKWFGQTGIMTREDYYDE